LTTRLAFLLVLTLLTACRTTPVADLRQSIDPLRQPVELIVAGGTILTMAGPNLTGSSIAIDDGRIVAIAPSAEISARFQPAEVIDASGKAVLPGFVNTHTHIPMTLFRGIADDRELMEWLHNFIFPAEAQNVDREFVRWGTRLGAAEMIASGTTTFADMYYFEDEIGREARAAGLRAVVGQTLIDFPAPDHPTWESAIAFSRQFIEEFRGDPLITAALAPHAPYTVSTDHLREVRALATELSAPILIHLAETEDEVRQIVERFGHRPVAYLESIGFLGRDVVAAHVVWPDESEIGILARRGVGVAHCPESNMMLASGIAPVVALRNAGVQVGLGTDGPAGSNNNLDMIEEMASAARLQKVTERNPRALGAREVLQMATIEGARVLGLDAKIGTLEIGKEADITIIDLATIRTQPVYSVESAIVYASSGPNVTHTIVRGQVLMRDRQLLTIDLPAVLERAEAYRRQITERLAAGRE
jgi:5-methylthioadenosine/S-adenosylhomocysteine deaminase